MLDCGPPTEHRSGAVMILLPDGRYHLAVGSTEMGNGSVTSHRQIAASVLGSRADSIDIINADTDLTPYDTGTFASTGTVVAGKAMALTAAALRDNILEYAGQYTGTDSSTWRIEDGFVVSGANRISLVDLHAAGIRDGHRIEAKGLLVASDHRIQRSWDSSGRPPDHRRNPYPPKRPRSRHRYADQSHAV